VAVLFTMFRPDGVELDPGRLHSYVVERKCPTSEWLVE
jgi:hypothetical protein